jgi:hypothetical protein
MSDVAFELIGMDEFKRVLARIGDDKEITRVASNSIRRGARKIRSETIKQERTRGVLRTIFAKKASGLQKLISVSRVKKDGAALEIRVTVKGLAQIQETGGTIRPHVIPKAFGRTGSVQHPGARHPQIPVFAGLVNRWSGPAMEDLRRSFSEHFAKVAARG